MGFEPMTSCCRAPIKILPLIQLSYSGVKLMLASKTLGSLIWNPIGHTSQRMKRGDEPRNREHGCPNFLLHLISKLSGYSPVHTVKVKNQANAVLKLDLILLTPLKTTYLLPGGSGVKRSLLLQQLDRQDVAGKVCRGDDICLQRLLPYPGCQPECLHPLKQRYRF